MKLILVFPTLLILYTWLGYPLLLWILRTVRSRCAKYNNPNRLFPSVTVMLTVHNEERTIRERLDNLKTLSYEGNLDFLVVSDASTDLTDFVAKEYAKDDDRFRLHRTARLGKSGAQNDAMRIVDSDIVVLTDADCSFRSDFIAIVVRYFEDPQVGCVTGNLYLVTEQGSIAQGLGLYWQFELLLRRLESETGVLLTPSGQCMAIRRSAFTPFEPIYGDDCVIPLDMALQGFRTVYAQDAVAYGSMPYTAAGELKARKRMITRNLTGILSRPTLLNPIHFPWASWSLFSHKLLRWLTPVFLVWCFTANLMLMPRSRIYAVALISQLALYALAGFGWHFDKAGKAMPISSQAYTFVLANIGFWLGIWAAIQGRRIGHYK